LRFGSQKGNARQPSACTAESRDLAGLGTTRR
jgi:hypothetical protein